MYVYLKRHWVPGCWVGSWPLWPRCRLKCYPHPSSSPAPAIVPPASGLQLLQHRFINCRKRRIHTNIKTPRASPWRALIYVLICNNAGLNWSSESTFPLPRTETNPSKGKTITHSLFLVFVMQNGQGDKTTHRLSYACYWHSLVLHYFLFAIATVYRIIIRVCHNNQISVMDTNI